jgi:polyhydroxybutyrate depolymerase
MIHRIVLAMAIMTIVSVVRAETVDRFIEHDGVKRRYVVYIPGALNKANGLRAALLDFHGGGGHAEQQMKTSGMNRVADQHGFIVVYPDGTSAGGPLLTWNAGRCCGYAARNRVDDVGFVRKIVAELVRDWSVDPRRIYAVGHSNGGMLAYRLAAEASDLIAGAGIVSADLAIDGPAPARPVPLIVFHGLKDQNVLWEGGYGPNQIDRNPHRSIPETLAIWKKWNHCADAPVRNETGAEYLMERYEPPAGTAGAPIVLYKLPNGGHSWPGGEPGAAFLNLGPHVKSVNASESIWLFFANRSQ